MAEPTIADQCTALRGRLDDLRAAADADRVRAGLDDMRTVIDELCRRAAELSRECQFLGELFRLAPDGHVVTDAAGTTRRVNRAATRLLDGADDDLVGRPLEAFADAPDRAVIRREIDHLCRSPDPDHGLEERRVRLRSLAGRVFHAGLTVAPTPDDPAGGTALHWAVRDITDRAETEDRLRRSEARLRAVLDTAFNGLITTDENGVVDAVNRMAERMFGYAQADVVGRPLSALVPAVRVDGDLRAGGESLVGAVRELTGRRRDGTTFPVELAVSEGRTDDRRFFTVVVRDVTDRKRADEALRRERDFAERLIATAQAAVLVLDLDGRPVRVNPYFADVTGYRPDEVVGTDWVAALVAEPDRECLRDVIRRAGGGEQVRGQVCPLVARGGDRREVEWSATPLGDGPDAAGWVLLLGHDVTGLLRARERAVQAERLAAIGQMVAGLAHESRNALQRGQAAVERLGARVGDQPEAVALLAELQQAQDHLHRLFEEVRSYAGPVRLDLRECYLADAWRAAWASLAAARTGRRAEFREESDVTASACAADPFRMEQVFRNVFANALEADPGPVKVTVRCDPADLRGAAAVRVTVCDDGPGFSPAERRNVFEPFYTTKTKGTGLGMAIVKRIVEAHGGTIEVGDRDCPGAEVVITLPRGKSSDQ